MADFLDTFDVERAAVLGAVDHLEAVWARFRQGPTLGAGSADLSDSLIACELALVKNALATTRFTVGVFGLIKRGKSTLLNALVGREVSAMRVTPETAVPVYVRYGPDPAAVVHFADGSHRDVAVEDARRFTSQTDNPGNRLGVTHVEQRVPVGFLENGACLVDTPGLDDAEADEVYTERTRQELEQADAGVLVFLSPPTVGAAEMEFLADVASRDLKKTFLVCNMYPQHFHDADARDEVLAYVRGRVSEAVRGAGHAGEIRVYPVCALEAWEARRAGDVDRWKRSGADRLLRDLDVYLSSGAGAQVLRDAAERVAEAAETAKAEVRVRQQLLADPERLADHRRQVDARVRDLERQFDLTMDRALAAVEPLQVRVRARILSTFRSARTTVEGCRSLGDVQQFAGRFRREVQVSGEAASREFSTAFAAIVERLRGDLEERFQGVMTDVAPNLPRVHLSSSALLMTPDQVSAFERAESRSRQASRSGMLAGGVAGGGTAYMAAGALLGPVGLVGGALVGWKLSAMIAAQSNLDRARALVLERLDEIAHRLLRDLDAQVERAVAAVRAGVDRRRRAFAADLYQQFDLVESIVEDPTRRLAQRRDADRFVPAFDACAGRARRAAGTVPVEVA